MQQRLWIERTFELGIPADHLPEIVERLRGTPARIEDRLRGIPPELLTSTAQGGWSIQTHVGHLIDLEPLWYRRYEELVNQVATLTAADMSNQRTNEADYDSRRFQDILAEFRFARMRFVAALENLADADLQKSSHHPRLNKAMRLTDLAFFAAEHDDHHLATITHILRSLDGV